MGKKTCDFREWLHFLLSMSFGQMTFSKRLGFVEQGVDVERIIHNLEEFMVYLVMVSSPLLEGTS